MSKFGGIIAMLEASMEPDPERLLDAEIAKLTGWTHEINLEEEYECWRDPSGRARYLPHFLTSVDAALELVERKLPGWEYGILRFRGLNQAYVQGGSGTTEAIGATLCFAILLALFRALEAQEAE